MANLKLIAKFFVPQRRGLDSLQNDHQHTTFFETVNLGEMVKCLEDLIDYFAQPEDNIGNKILIKYEFKLKLN